jgi:signal transduction histidine kinase
MFQLRWQSIRVKALAMILLGSIVPMGIVLVMVAIQDVRAIRGQILSEYSLIATIIADYAVGDIAFDNRSEAEQSLSVLGRLNDVEYIALYDARGERFAAYRRPDVPKDWIPARISGAVVSSAETSDDHIDVVRFVEHEGVRYGTILLRASTALLAMRTRSYLWGLMAAGIALVVIATAFAFVVQRSISRPVLRLTEVARRIARYEDYSVRAAKVSNDEIGFLAETFNAMLAEIEKRQQQAAEAIQVRDDFLSIASHELRTPITGLKLAVDQLGRQAARGGGAWGVDKWAACLDRMNRQVSRLELLVGNLLDVTRITGGSFVLDLTEFDLCALVFDVVERFADEFDRARCHATLSAPPSIVGHWDRLRIDQVVTNLISNAVKYAAGASVEIILEEHAGTARLLVVDHGMGVPDSAKGKIFGRFERAPSALYYGGLGLGLFISLQIVRAHGGRIEVRDTPGGGATFVVDLPRRRG